MRASCAGLSASGTMRAVALAIAQVFVAPTRHDHQFCPQRWTKTRSLWAKPAIKGPAGAAGKSASFYVMTRTRSAGSSTPSRRWQRSSYPSATSSQRYSDDARSGPVDADQIYMQATEMFRCPNRGHLWIYWNGLEHDWPWLALRPRS